MVSLQGSGKSTWVRKHLPASHVVVSKNYWPRARNREARQRRAVEDALAAGYSVVVDNTNASPRNRAPLIEIAGPAAPKSVPSTLTCHCRCVWRVMPTESGEHAFCYRCSRYSKPSGATSPRCRV
jgi:ribosomal protein S30